MATEYVYDARKTKRKQAPSPPMGVTGHVDCRGAWGCACVPHYVIYLPIDTD